MSLRKSNWLPIVIVVAIVLFIYGAYKYNHIATADEALNKAWTPLVSQLQLRYSAVPKLVNVIILYTGKEDEPTKQLADAYKKFQSASGMEAKVKVSNEIEAALDKVYVQATQRYIGINSHYQFTMLKRTFEATDKKMKQGPVGGYNNAVSDYNTYVRKFPNNLVALLLGFDYKGIYFKTGEE